MKDLAIWIVEDEKKEIGRFFGKVVEEEKATVQAFIDLFDKKMCFI